MGLKLYIWHRPCQQKLTHSSCEAYGSSFGMDTTYSIFCKQSHTNARVIERASAEIGGQKCETLSDMLMAKRAKLARHIMRTPQQDPLRQVSCQPNSAQMFHIGKRRVGGPRQNWLFYRNKFTWQTYTARPFAPYANSFIQNQYIYENRVNRHFKAAPRARGLTIVLREAGDFCTHKTARKDLPLSLPSGLG